MTNPTTPRTQSPRPNPTVAEIIRKDYQFDHSIPDAIRDLKAVSPSVAKNWLCKIIDFGEYDGHGHDQTRCSIAQCIEDLEVALASQIDISNIERVQVHMLLQKLDTRDRELSLLAERLRVAEEQRETIRARLAKAFEHITAQDTSLATARAEPEQAKKALKELADAVLAGTKKSFPETVEQAELQLDAIRKAAKLARSAALHPAKDKP